MTESSERGLKRLIYTALPADAVRERSATLHASCLCGCVEDMGADDRDLIPEEAET